MITLLFCASVFSMAFGHVFKVKRWKQFITVYEDPRESDLLSALAIGHTLNAILPFRIGGIVRIILAGRKLENGYAFALATVFADLYVDVITVGGMLFGLSIIGKGGESMPQTAILYAWACLMLLLLTVAGIVFRKQIKKMIAKTASLFNERIEFNFLYVSYLCIASLEDLVKRINKRQFVRFTLLMWGGYVASYMLFAETVQYYGFFYSTSEVFRNLFSGSSLYHVERALVPLWAAYLLVPLVICIVISGFMNRKPKKRMYLPHQPLPQLNRTDRLAFLRIYYAEENRARIRAYLEINSDVTVLEDNSAGSNATTVLVMKPDGKLFYRKYAFGEDANKLRQQIEWLNKHREVIPLPLVSASRDQNGYVAYDMPGYQSAILFFRFIHTKPVDTSWILLEKALEEIRNGLHTKNVRQADSTSIRRYIEEKVLNNLEKLNSDRFIRTIEQYEEVVVNGISYPTLHNYHTFFEKEFLRKIFSADEYADIHGDLTVENIICLSDPNEIETKCYLETVKPTDHYFIDPNTGNIHESPFLDYGKLLQSLHGNYEFLTAVNSIRIDRNQVDFFVIKSAAYSELYERYQAYLRQHFDRRQVLSIYCHEVAHWLRLLPYKIRKDERLAVVFYSGLLAVLKDVWGLACEDRD